MRHCETAVTLVLGLGSGMGGRSSGAANRFSLGEVEDGEPGLNKFSPGA